MVMARKNRVAKEANMTTPLWKITKIEDVATFVAGSGVQPSKKVTFELLDGTQSSLTIPDTQFTPNETARRVNDMATKLIQTLSLEGPDMEQQPPNFPS